MNELAQPILVAKGGTHTETIACAARASLAAYITPLLAGQDIDPAWKQWLSGQFTKTVRRAPRSHLDKALQWAADTGKQATGREFGDSAAVAATPMTYADYPKVFAKAQVAGTALPCDSSTLKAPTGPTIHLLGTLSTGKAAAQAAHGLWMWALPLIEDDPAALAAWLEDGMPLGLRQERPEALADLAEAHWVVVQDAGLTEVAPNTVTAVVSTPTGSV